jgi:hypothetical protein
VIQLLTIVKADFFYPKLIVARRSTDMVLQSSSCTTRSTVNEIR